MARNGYIMPPARVAVVESGRERVASPLYNLTRTRSHDNMGSLMQVGVYYTFLV